MKRIGKTVHCMGLMVVLVMALWNVALLDRHIMDATMNRIMHYHNSPYWDSYYKHTVQDKQESASSALSSTNNSNNNSSTVIVQHFPLPHKTGGLVHYTTTPYSGWNNQRQAAVVAWIIAYCTGHTLQYKTFHPAYTGVNLDDDDDGDDYTHADFWDWNRLSQHVAVHNISHRMTGDNYEFAVNMDTVFESPDQIQAQLTNYSTVTYVNGWNFLQHSFPWIHPHHEIFVRMVESFTYNEQIQAIANQVVEQLPSPFVALHIRKDQAPALDCDLLGLATIHGKGYQQGGCVGVDWNQVVQRLFPGMPIYVAHDGSAPALPPTTRQASDFGILSTLRPAILSAVEQEIVARAECFIASTHSSWSEYVIYKRVVAHKKDGQQNYDIWTRNIEYLHQTPDLSRAES